MARKQARYHVHWSDSETPGAHYYTIDDQRSRKGVSAEILICGDSDFVSLLGYSLHER